MIRTRVAIVLAGMAAAVSAAPTAAGAAQWQLEQPDPPPGAVFKVPLGAPGDIQAWSRNRVLLGIQGNASVPRGLFVWNGAAWHQLSTVCGGSGDTMRIAWAAADEFWTVTEPSLPRRGNGTSLCHFKGGQVIDSFSTPDESSDPYFQMDSAACNGPSDCWFGGFGAQDPLGQRVGAFHLHWDGVGLETVYAPQGRAVSDIVPFGGVFFETVLVGRAPENRTDPVDLVDPEGSQVKLIHRLNGRTFSNDPFVPSQNADGGTELLGLDTAGGRLWAAGGGAASGPLAPVGGSFARGPLALEYSGGAWQEKSLGGAVFGPDDRFVDVASVPGADEAWVAVQSFAERNRTNVRADVAHIDGATGATTVTPLPVGGSGRGAAAKVEFTAPNDGWMVTNAGWIFHYTDGEAVAVDTDPAFAGTITRRPNESAAQFIPDLPPMDDSTLLGAPPVTVNTPPAAPANKTKKLKPVLKNVKSARKGHTLIVSFTLVRKARVGLVARKGRKIVGKVKPKLLRPGKHALKLQINFKRYPTGLKFSIKEPGVGGGGGGGGDNNVTTGPGAPNTVGT